MAITLNINGINVVLNQDQKFTIVYESPYLSKGGEYSYSIPLNLHNTINNSVFGVVNRHDVTAKHRKFSAELSLDNAPILKGIATITNINENEVELQLLANLAELNFDATFKTTFLDELPFGKIVKFQQLLHPDDKVYYGDDAPPYDPIADDIFVYEVEMGHTFSQSLINQISKFDYENESVSEGARTYYIDYPWMMKCLNQMQYDFSKRIYFFPCKNESLEELNINIPIKYEHAKPERDVFIEINKPSPFVSEENRDIYTYSSAPTMSFLDALNQVISKLGYSLNANPTATNGILFRLYIASAAVSNKIADCLPHWSISQYIDEVEKFCNFKLLIDYTNKTIDILTPDDINSLPPLSITAIDEFDTELLEEKVCKLSYGLPSSEEYQYDAISDELLSNCTIVYINSTSEIPLNSPEDTIYKNQDLNYFYVLNGEIIRINTFEDSTKIAPEDITLNIKPSLTFFDLQGVLGSPGSNLDNPSFYHMDYIPIYVGQGKINSIKWNNWNLQDECKFSLKDSVEGVANDTSPADEMRVFLWEGGKDYNYGDTFSGPWIYSDALRDFPPDGEAHCHFSLSLNGYGHPLSIGALQHGGFNETIIYKKTILSDTIPDLTRPWLIRAKKYICKKLTVEFSADGLNKLMKVELCAL